jgi:cell division topological specificity factor
MSLFSFFKTRGTAPVARERLQILLAHERVTLGPRNLIAILRDELLATIAKHIDVSPEALKIKMGQAGAVSTLEIDLEIPTEKIGAKAIRPEPAHAKVAAASR